MMKNCVVCDAEFIAPKNNATTAMYCSPKCKLHVQKSKYRKKNPLPDIVCKVCGKVTKPMRVGGVTCSTECSKEQRRQQKANRVKTHFIDRKCPTCGKNDFKQYGNFKRHVSKCKKRTCTVCDKTFFTRRDKQEVCGCQPKPYDTEERKKRSWLSAKGKGFPQERKCVICKESFSAYHGLHKYCSRKCKDKKKVNPCISISRRIGDSLRKQLKQEGIEKRSKTFDILGYTKQQAKEHLESFFTEENGYSWDNMNEWHIDHIRPVSSFNFTTTDCEDFKKCWALSNLQPLWAADNIRKGNKWDGEAEA